MTIEEARPGSNGRKRPSLNDQLDRLDAILNGLSEALNESVAAAVVAAVGTAVREAMESATRQMIARCAPPTKGIIQLDLTPKQRWSHRASGRTRLLVRRALLSASRAVCGTCRRLLAPPAASVRRAMNSPRRLATFTLTGMVAGATAGVWGPLVGTALGASAGFVTFISSPSLE